MVVFAWILFVITALVTLGSLFTWFNDGEIESLFTLLGSIAGLVYLIFYLFITPFAAVATWVYFIATCLLALVALLLRKVFPLVEYTAFAVFFALVLFL